MQVHAVYLVLKSTCCPIDCDAAVYGGVPVTTFESVEEATAFCNQRNALGNKDSRGLHKWEYTIQQLTLWYEAERAIASDEV